MLRDYKTYITKIIINKDFESDNYETFMKSLFQLLIHSLEGNENKKLKYIDHIRNLYPISKKVDLGELKLVSEIMEFQDIKLSFFQLEVAHIYVRNAWKDLKIQKPDYLKNEHIQIKIFYLLKLVIVLLQNDQKIDDDLVQIIV